MTQFDKPTVVFGKVFTGRPNLVTKEIFVWRKLMWNTAQEHEAVVKTWTNEAGKMCTEIILYYSLKKEQSLKKKMPTVTFTINSPNYAKKFKT